MRLKPRMHQGKITASTIPHSKGTGSSKGSKDDLDLYAYVGGDPVNKADPTGNDGITFSVEGFIAEKCGGCEGGYGSVGIAIGVDRNGNPEISTFPSTGDIKKGEGGIAGADAGLGFYSGNGKEMEKTTDTAGGVIGTFGGSASYMGDKNGMPTGKGPVSGAIPVVGKALQKTVGKVSVGLGLGVFHTKATTKVDTTTVKTAPPMTQQQACKAITDRSHPTDC